MVYRDEAHDFASEVKEFENLRSTISHVQRDYSGCSLLRRYYAQLHSLKGRFQMTNLMDLLMQVKFSWRDIYTEKLIIGDIHYEMCSVLYNLGVLHVELASLETRTNDASLKLACSHFQCAAHAFEMINKEVPVGIRSNDMSHDMICFMYNISLAQAQECILEKSLASDRNVNIIAKVAAQLSEYYTSSVMVLLQGSLNNGPDTVQEVVGSREFKLCMKYCEFKSAYFKALCDYYMGLSNFESQKMGEAIAWFKSAYDKIGEAVKHLKGLDKQNWSGQLNDACKLVQELIQKKQESAEKENNFIFHQPVPSSDKLTAVKGASLVKGIPFDVTDNEILGMDIFRRLVPLEAYQVASIYTARKDDLIRSVHKRIEEKDLEISEFMSSLQLNPQAIRPVNPPVPDQLIDVCATLSLRKSLADDAKSHLSQLLAKSKLLDESLNLLLEDIELLDWSSKGKILPQWQALRDIHDKAIEADLQLKQSFLDALPDVEFMVTFLNDSSSTLSKLLPEAEIPVDEENIKKLENLMKKIDEMKKQRENLFEQLKQDIRNEDITNKVLMSSGQKGGGSEMDLVFEKEMKKFDRQISLIDMNLAAQENIMNALIKENAEYAPTRKAVMQAANVRKGKADCMTSSYQKMVQVIPECEKRMKVHEETLKGVTRLEEKVKSIVNQVVNTRPQAPTVNSTCSTSSVATSVAPTVSSTLPSQITVPSQVIPPQVQVQPHLPPIQSHIPHPQQGVLQQPFPPFAPPRGTLPIHHHQQHHHQQQQVAGTFGPPQLTTTLPPPTVTPTVVHQGPTVDLLSAPIHEDSTPVMTPVRNNTPGYGENYFTQPHHN